MDILPDFEAYLKANSQQIVHDFDSTPSEHSEPIDICYTDKASCLPCNARNRCDLALRAARIIIKHKGKYSYKTGDEKNWGKVKKVLEIVGRRNPIDDDEPRSRAYQ